MEEHGDQLHQTVHIRETTRARLKWSKAFALLKERKKEKNGFEVLKKEIALSLSWLVLCHLGTS